MTITIAAMAQNPWIKVDETKITADRNDRSIIPDAYETFYLDLPQLKKQLLPAPMEDIKDTRKEGIVVELPLPDGTTSRFEFVESPNMSPVLSAKYPHIKSYSGRSLDDPTSHARIDADNYGFHE